MGIYEKLKCALGMEVHQELPKPRPITSEEIKNVQARQAEIQTRLKVLEVESELYKRNVK